MTHCAKIPYYTIGDANLAVRAMANKRVLRVYKCPVCKVYHLTSQVDHKGKPIEEQVERNNKQLREQISFKDNLIEQLYKDIDNKTESLNLLKTELKIQKDRFYFRSRLEDEFFKNKPIIFEEWKQLNIDNPFLTSKDFE